MKTPPEQRSLPLFGSAVAPGEPTTKKRRPLAPGKNQPEHDLVMTPPWLADQIVDYFAPRGRLLDPARGEGAFYNAMLRHSSAVQWCERTEGRDFYSWHDPVDWIITNPPWSKLRPFLLHSMTLAPNVVFLCTITHVVTKARLRDIDRAGFGIAVVLPVRQPPPPWPGSGFQLAAVLVQRGAALLAGMSGVGAFPIREVTSA